MFILKRPSLVCVPILQAGINDEGKGVVYRYDPVGFMEELTQGSGGAAVALVQPFLDNQVERNNRNDRVEGKQVRGQTSKDRVW